MITKLRSTCLVLCLLAIASCGTVPKTSVPVTLEGPPLASVDDSLYAHVLDHAVTTSGNVDYAELAIDTDLTAYLDQISRVRLDAFASRAQLLAFWINTHNAYVLDLIRNNWNSGLVRSIDDISGFRYAKVLIVDGKRYSLDGIEHEIIEKEFREPRAFFALFDGSNSSPQLRLAPYNASELSDQLDQQLKSFVADSTKNYVDRRSNTLYLSPIFETYAADLQEATGGTVADFVRLFAPPEMAAWIARHSNPHISYVRYDYTIHTNTPAPTHEQYYRPAARREDGGIK